MHGKFLLGVGVGPSDSYNEVNTNRGTPIDDGDLFITE
jgi:hypothetical protein